MRIRAETIHRIIQLLSRRCKCTVVISLRGVVASSAAVHGFFTAVNEVRGGPRVRQPRKVAHVASQHPGPAETLWH